MKKSCLLSVLIPLIGAATAVQADSSNYALVVTASNATANQLLVYNSGGTLIQTVPTGGREASAATRAASRHAAT